VAGRRTQCFGSHHPIAALPAPFGEYWVPGRGISGNEAHTGVSRSSGTAYLPTGLASRPAVRDPPRPGISSEAGESRSPIQPARASSVTCLYYVPITCETYYVHVIGT